MLYPRDARVVRHYPISTRINHVAYDDEECCRAAAPSPEVKSVFFPMKAPESSPNRPCSAKGTCRGA